MAGGNLAEATLEVGKAETRRLATDKAASAGKVKIEGKEARVAAAALADADSYPRE